MRYTPEYLSQQKSLHQKGNYGVIAGKMYGTIVSTIVDKMEIDHLLDYGCGKNLSLTKGLKTKREFKYQAYDPMVGEYSDEPVPAQMVCCIDVIEHIEPDYLEDVLDHLEELTEEVLFISVHTGPAGKVLDDGRNAHLIQQPLIWWLPKIAERFEVQSVQVQNKKQFYVIAFNKNLDDSN